MQFFFKIFQTAEVRVIAAFLAAMTMAACQGSSTSTEAPAVEAFPEVDISMDKLHGAYVDAGANTPVVLIVPGSGPINRNGNMSGMKSNIYKLLAEGLAGEGISTVRVDKRGMFSSRAAGDPNAVTLDMYASDYRGWIDKVIEHTGQSCVYLLGHSEGGLMVTKAAIGQSDVCGLILAAAPGRPLGDVLREQLKANPANFLILKDAFKAIDALEGGQKVDVSDMHAALKGLFAPVVQDFLVSVFAVDPVELLSQSAKPVLILQGRTDIQVSVEDAQKLAVVPQSQLVVLEGVNHVLKSAPANRAKNMAVYNMPKREVDPRVIDAIVEFIK